MEIDITTFFENADPFEFSRSCAEGGQNAGPETWAAALREGAESPILKTKEELDALRDHCKGFGAWTPEEIAAWSPAECNALFIQMISGDMREAGFENCFPDEIDWTDYEKRSEKGTINGLISRSVDGRVYYYLGD